VGAAAPGLTAPVTFNVITLSAGGQFGAFGAGFVTGWSENPATPRPVFDMVTGVSTGAIIAPAVFAGPRFDPLLRTYRGLSQGQVLRLRPLAALFGAPALASTEPLQGIVESGLSPGLRAAVAARYAAGDRLLVMATNLDTGAGEVLDLGAAAAADPAKCMAEAILASAAVPALMPPRHINGALYADGGLRDQLFLRALDTARARVARETGREIRVEAYLVINGSLAAPAGPVEDRLYNYVGRSIGLLADEALRSSILGAVALAEARPNWRLRGIAAEVDFTPCGESEAPAGTFDPCITRLLFDAGRAAGRAAPIDWWDAAELRAAAEAL
jgi:predicted acylesterase/phospholipase RssA